MDDAEYLRTDPLAHRVTVISGDPLERARQRLAAATAERSRLEREIAGLRYNLNPLLCPHEDRLRFVETARLRLRAVYDRYAEAVTRESEARQDCMRLKPRPQLRRDRPSSVVWLDRPVRQARDMPDLSLKSGEDWLRYCRRAAR